MAEERENKEFTVIEEGKPPTKGPCRGGKSYLCSVEGAAKDDPWTEAYLDVKSPLQIGAAYKAATITNLARRGKHIYGTALDITPVGGPSPAMPNGERQAAHGVKPFLDLATEIMKFVNCWEETADCIKAELAGCMWRTMAYNGGVMEEMEQRAGEPDGDSGAQEPDPADRLPADDDIPF